MSWFSAGAFAVIALGVAAFTYTLTTNIEPQPEYPVVMTKTMRLIGFAITTAAVVFALIMFGYAGLQYGW